MMHAARRKSPKIAIWAPSHNFVNTCLSCEDIARQSEEKLVKQQYLLQMSHNMVNFGTLAAKIDPGVCGIPANFDGFRVLAALTTARHSTSGRQPNCGVEQRAPITLGIGPHSSLFYFCFYLVHFMFVILLLFSCKLLSHFKCSRKKR